MGRKIKWLSSPADRGNIIMTYGNIYDLDDLAKPIDPDSLGVWEREGVLKFVEEGKPEPEEETPTEPETITVEEPVKIKEITSSGITVVTSIPKDSDIFKCPNPDGDCDRTYKRYWDFIKHMRSHGQDWKVEGNNVVKED